VFVSCPASDRSECHHSRPKRLPKYPQTFEYLSAEPSSQHGNAPRTMNKTRPTSPATTEELDQRTLLLIRRVLCTHSPPTTPLEELLPALTSSAEVDVQLYAFIAIIARDFILSWYGEISNDHAFLDEVIALIAHCTRSLQERLREVDLEVLLLDEVPAILDAHVRGILKPVSKVLVVFDGELTCVLSRLPQSCCSAQHSSYAAPHPSGDLSELPASSRVDESYRKRTAVYETCL
jgi:hypothetical protein